MNLFSTSEFICTFSFTLITHHIYAQKLPTDLREIFSRKVGNGSLNNLLNFGGNPVHCLDSEIVFRIRHYWEIQKVVNGHSFIVIRQMAALIRRALAEVCTVPVLLATEYVCLTYLVLLAS